LTKGSIKGEMYSTGIKGAERFRLEKAKDPRIKHRVYFYVDSAEELPRPEPGLSPHVYTIWNSNIYDDDIDPEILWGQAQGMVDRGRRDGYY